MARCADARVYDDGHAALFDDDAQEVARTQSEVAADGRAEGHNRCCAGLFEPFAERGVGLAIGQHDEAFLSQHLRGA